MRNLGKSAATTRRAAHSLRRAPSNPRALLLFILVLIASVPVVPYWYPTAVGAEPVPNPSTPDVPRNPIEEQKAQLEKLQAEFQKTQTEIDKTKAELENLHEKRIHLEKLQAELQKTQTEIDKTKAEVENLRRIGPGLNRLATITTSMGGLIGAIFGALIAGALAWAGQRINQSYNNAQKNKLDHDLFLATENHFLELYRRLGSENTIEQIAAASVLFERLKTHPSDDANTIVSVSSSRTIGNVLISVCKYSANRDFGSFRKYIADNLVRAFDLVNWDGYPDENRELSMLATFDLQRCNLRDVWWRGVNLRGVDLYGSDLSGASLRNADLRKAVLYESNLTDCILAGANLAQANLGRALVVGADFRGANLTGAWLDGAKFDARTIWPVGFSAVEAGAVDVTSVDALPREAAFPY